MKKYDRVCWCAKPSPNRRAVMTHLDACKCSRCHGVLTAFAMIQRKVS